ncbi:hypothetical protein [Pseudomonas oryzihabitans]|uniref:hypothetical protein n=1 Tax=Pseudomonas oryzihabitans TaxID=47885 RepID=UPI00214E77E4|nr:hypothetical protein [Pseudomonas psychrotolerans]UUW74232.1 hypothetical protein NRG74_23075 [Pseudomonas psychrotolerans]
MTRLQVFCFALLGFATSSVLAALPDLAPRSEPSFVASRAYFIADDQYLVATKPDGANEVRICPGRYVERASGPVCRVLDPDGLNHFLGGTVTGETFTLDETVQRLSGGNGTLKEMTRSRRDNPGFLLSVAYPSTADLHMQHSLEDIAVAAPTVADIVGRSSAVQMLAIGVAFSVLLFAAFLGFWWWEGRRVAARRGSQNDLIEAYAAAARARSPAPQVESGPPSLTNLAAAQTRSRRSPPPEPPELPTAAKPPAEAKVVSEEPQSGRKLFLD